MKSEMEHLKYQTHPKPSLGGKLSVGEKPLDPVGLSLLFGLANDMGGLVAPFSIQVQPVVVIQLTFSAVCCCWRLLRWLLWLSRDESELSIEPCWSG